MPSTSRMRLNYLLLPPLVLVLLFLQIYAPSRVWTMLLAGLSLTTLIGYLWARSLAKKLSLVREMRFGWAQVGDQLEERFTLINAGWMPGLWVEIIDHSTLFDYQASRATGVGGGAINQWRTHGICTRRGLYKLGPTSLRTGDPLGIFTVDQEYPASATLVVMPPVIPLPAIEVAPGGRSGEGRPRANAPEQTVSASGVREYIPGDSLRLIHWRTTARRDATYVHLLDGTPAGDWWIILDLDQSVQVGQGWESTVEYGVILAASLADRGLRAKRAVGLVSNSQELTWLHPQEGEGQKWEILRTLALVNPGEYNLNDLLMRLGTSIGKRTSVMIVTPNVSNNWIEALIPLLWCGAVPTVLLLDPASFGDTAVGNTAASQVAARLAEMGLAHYIITRQMLNKPEARPGRKGQWEWKTSPYGRAVPVRQPGDMTWKVLS